MFPQVYRLAKKCKVYGKLILRKIIKIVATIIFKTKMPQIRFRLRLHPDLVGGVYSAPPTH